MAATDPWKAAAVKTAWVSGVFCIIVLTLLILNHTRSHASDPLKSERLTQLKGALAHNPADDQLKSSIRELDLELRQVHARHLALNAQAAWLLLAGLGIFLVSIRHATYRKKLPRPNRTPEEARRHAEHQTQVAVIFLAALTFAGAWAWSQLAPAPVEFASPRPGAEATGTEAAAAAEAPTTPVATDTPVTPEEWARNWPRFRGPGGAGVSIHTNLTLRWNVASGQGIRWKVPVPISGPNSPIVWGERVFLSGASATKREVYCFDAKSGNLSWQKQVEIPAAKPSEGPTVMEDSGGHAAATMATDGRRVFAVYANGDLAAFDLAGNPAWSKNLGVPENHYGHASSLVTAGELLLVQFDQGEAKDAKSRLLALNTKTGEMVWQSEPRPVPNSWSTPITFHDGQRQQVVTTGNPWVLAYDTESGKELWRAKLLTGEVTPSAIFDQGLVFAAMEGETLSAIRPDGSGEVTKTHVAWQGSDGLPDICCPLSDGQRVYVLNTYGALTCYALKDGKKVWENDLAIGFHASPSLVGGRILLVNDDGIGVVIAAGDTFSEVSRSELGEKVLASPAFADGRCFIRTKDHLFCLGEAAK